MLHKLLRLAYIARRICLRDLIKLVMWYCGLKGNISLVVNDKCKIYLTSNVKRDEGIWYILTILNAIEQGFIVKISQDRIYVRRGEGLCNVIPFNNDGILVLSYIVRLYKYGAILRDDLVILPEGILIKYPREDPLALSIVHEVFIEQQWNFLDVRNKVVIDVGAYVGESSIYFSMKGASKVIAYEPNPLLYSLLLENINLNKLTSRIVAHNCAITSQESVVKLVIPRHSAYAIARTGLTATINSESEHYITIRSARLPLEGDVLKMDCEGCEYNALLSIEPRNLPFQEIGLEYHGSPQPLIKHLKRGGYKVKILEKRPNKGILYAYKR